MPKFETRTKLLEDFSSILACVKTDAKTFTEREKNFIRFLKWLKQEWKKNTFLVFIKILPKMNICVILGSAVHI